MVGEIVKLLNIVTDILHGEYFSLRMHLFICKMIKYHELFSTAVGAVSGSRDFARSTGYRSALVHCALRGA